MSESLDRMISGVRAGDRAAVDDLFGLVYEELRRIAGYQLRRERAGHTLHPTALVHEAYLKLGEPRGLELADRGHFVAIAARAMRQVLVEHARRRAVGKRGGDWVRTMLRDDSASVELKADELLLLDEAFAHLTERQRAVVDCKFFGGLTEQETADAIGISERTVRREWVAARAWLYRAIYTEDKPLSAE